MISIDGRAGAGKSSLTSWLSKGINVCDHLKQLGRVVYLISVTALGTGVAAPKTAVGQDLHVMQLEEGLGSVLGAEKACGLTYNQTAIQAYIEKHAPPGDMTFGNTVDMWPLAKRAKLHRCRLQERQPSARKTLQ